MTQEEIKRSHWNQAAQYGLILGGALSLIIVVSVLLRLDINNPYLTSIVQYAVMVIALNTFCRRRGAELSPDAFTYGQNMSFILSIMIFTGIIVGVVTFIMHQFIAPNYYREVLEMAVEKSAEEGNIITDQELEATLSIMRRPIIMVFSGMFGMILNGGFIGIFVAIFTRRKAIETTETETEQNDTE